MERADFERDAKRIIEKTAESLLEEVLALYDKMKPDEREKIGVMESVSPGRYSPAYRAAKVLLIATADERIQKDWLCESMKPQVRLAKRVRRLNRA